MLIRWATPADKPAWTALAGDVAMIFENPVMQTDPEFHAYMDRKLSKFEALAAVDRRSGNLCGIIGFSRTHNRITWFGVFAQYRGRGIGTQLLTIALRQLDRTKPVTVETFREEYAAELPARAAYRNAGFVETDHTLFDHRGNPRCQMVLAPDFKRGGGSFHYRYPEYDRYAKEENCLCCNHAPMPDSNLDIAKLACSYAVAERDAQGRLFGKCHVVIKQHNVNFEDIPAAEMTGFMRDVQQVGKALRSVTGAVKINYELHSNSFPHIHCHLFPRYLNDDFPSGPIDYRITEPSPYEDEEEFLWFIRRMREELSHAETNLFAAE
ncbi:MAG: GNAT family N-acetyltransferase [Oscillospiraceae bacterium]